MRASLANTKPPEEIEVCGGFYSINYDFRTWAEVVELIKGINPSNESKTVETMWEIERLVFGGMIDAPLDEVLRAVAEFAHGYPDLNDARKENLQSTIADSTEELISFKYDMNYIILAIRNQSGVDLSYRRQEPFHWWEFLLEVQSLTADHYISYIASKRAYKGSDREELRLKQLYSLPIELDEETKAVIMSLDE